MNRRSFLRSALGVAFGLATGGLWKVVKALTTRRTSIAWVKESFSAGYFYFPYIPLQVTHMITPGTVVKRNYAPVVELADTADSKPAA